MEAGTVGIPVKCESSRKDKFSIWERWVTAGCSP